MKVFQNKKIFITILSVIFSGIISAQNESQFSTDEDSLSLEWIIQEVIQHHPIVQSAQEALNKADAQIGLANSGYYPNVSFSANINTVGPVPSLSIPDLGSFSLTPRNNVSGAFSVEQNIYDFGKTAHSVELADESKKLTQQSMEQVKQNLALKAVQVYYSLDFLQEAIRIKDEQLKTLNEHLAFVSKRKETGSATDYEILSTQVKISGIESQKLDLQASLEIQLSALNSLLGQPAKVFHNVKQDMEVEKSSMTGNSMFSYAYQNRNEMIIAKEKEQLAAMRVEQVKTQNNPSLYFIANGGAKNGFVPDIKRIRANYAVGLGVSIPIFDGTREKYKVLEAQSAVETSTLETEITRRNISSEVVENETNLKTATKKINQAKLQLKQAEKALSLANVSYESGVITNLDLLDATTAVSESRLLLLKSQIDYVVNIYRLNASLGEKLY